MSKNDYSDYNDLLLNCQNSGKYRLFTFDIKNSRKVDTPSFYIFHYDNFFIIERVYQDLLLLQKKLGKQILINDIGYYRFLENPDAINRGQMPWDWFMFGDMVGITIYNNSIPAEVVYKIFELNEKEMNLDFEFHKSDLVYETDDYVEGGKKYFRGYAILTCSNLHKKYNKDLKKKIDKIKNISKNNEDEINYYMEIVNSNHNTAVLNAINELSKPYYWKSEAFMDINGNYNYKFFGNEQYGYAYEEQQKQKKKKM